MRRRRARRARSGRTWRSLWRTRRSARRARRPLWRRVARFGLLVLVASTAATALPILALRFIPPPTTAFMLRSRVSDPASGQPCERVAYRWVPREAISRDLVLAVLVAEDQRFFEHRGFDFDGIRRALRDRERSGRVRGASTLTQQLVKNLFLWPESSWLRKGIEAWLTFSIEQLWPKQRILETYLNVVQFGPCVYGAGAASLRYFDRTPDQLEPRQAALLAAVLPNPHKLRAHSPGPHAQERTEQILELMETHRWLLRRL